MRLPGLKSARTSTSVGRRVGSPFLQAGSAGSHQRRTSVLLDASLLLKLGLHTTHRPTQLLSEHTGHPPVGQPDSFQPKVGKWRYRRHKAASFTRGPAQSSKHRAPVGTASSKQSKWSQMMSKPLYPHRRRSWSTRLERRELVTSSDCKHRSAFHTHGLQSQHGAGRVQGGAGRETRCGMFGPKMMAKP